MLLHVNVTGILGLVRTRMGSSFRPLLFMLLYIDLYANDNQVTDVYQKRSSIKFFQYLLAQRSLLFRNSCIA